jgi:hypothetical protein
MSPEHEMEAERGRVAACLSSFFNLSTMWEWVVNVTPRLLYPRQKETVIVVQETGWVPGTVWTNAENLALTRFESRTVQPVASRYTD